MFPGKKEKEKKIAAIADKVSILAEGLRVRGDIESDGDIRIDGTVQGNIFCNSKVVIISTGKVVGDIQAVNIDIHGTVEGNITAGDLLSLKATSKITGNLKTSRLQIEPNAVFDGQCTMQLPAARASLSAEGIVLQEN